MKLLSIQIFIINKYQIKIEKSEMKKIIKKEFKDKKMGSYKLGKLLRN